MKHYYTYQEFREDTKRLLKLLKTERYDGIVAISRGGLTLSHCIAEGLDLRDVQSIRTELYDDMTKRDVIKLFGECKFEHHKKVLVVDDIADSGETLQFVMNHLTRNYEGVTFESATLFYKKTSVYEPNFWIKEASMWIDFFWERDYKEE
ncbi:phosphoribosyltransferase family protein [Sulfurimonas sp. C5]|uniref:phosphoribosyltransferase n=1 Tax=Sulfurimonas sp. C5 TaxID=3036947 RepID=UPI00245847A6|nr:phosphoribosyltransferase family protein [Sulfurimonas sp. C5]MDH4945414.1 phosphoribosyltransferase family protein [Sulfurimonas sp. C5]